jgi:hypothetical protein
MPIVKKLVSTQGHNPTSMTVLNKAYSAGGGAGQTVSVDLSSFFVDGFGTGFLPTDGRYFVGVTTSTPTIPSVTGKGNSGFTVLLTPITAAATISAGQMDCYVIGP